MKEYFSASEYWRDKIEDKKDITENKNYYEEMLLYDYKNEFISLFDFNFYNTKIHKIYEN